MKKYSIIILIGCAALIGTGSYFLTHPTERISALEQQMEEQEKSDIEKELDPDLLSMSFETYTNFDFGVRFVYPIDWEIQEKNTQIRFYSNEVLEITNQGKDERSDILMEFDLDLPGPAKDIFVNELHFEHEEKNGMDYVYFERDEPVTGLRLSYHIVEQDDHALSAIYPKDHPYANFLKYMIDSVEFFDPEE